MAAKKKRHTKRKAKRKHKAKRKASTRKKRHAAPAPAKPGKRTIFVVVV